MDRSTFNNQVLRNSIDQAVGQLPTIFDDVDLRVQTLENISTVTGITRSQSILANIPSSINFISTTGYATPGDGGKATYKKVNTQPSHSGKFQSADGAWWEINEQEINAFQFGAKGDGSTVDTVALQSSLDVAGALGVPVRWKKPTTNYKVGALVVPDASLLLILDPGTIIFGDPSIITGSVRLLTISGSKDVTIRGYGASITTTKPGSPSGQSHNIHIVPSGGRVVIEGLLSSNSGGDGFYVKCPLADVVLRDVIADNNSRQGLSIVECKSFTDYGGWFKGTSGATGGPCSGVDIEPNGPTDVLGSVRFYKSRASGNAGSGFLVFLYLWNSVTNFADIEFFDCRSDGNATSTSSSLNMQGGFEIRRIANTTPCGGKIRLINCTSVNDGYAGIRVYNKDKNGPLVEIVRPNIFDANAQNSAVSSEQGGIVVYSDGLFGTTPGKIRIVDPYVYGSSGKYMVYAVLVNNNGGGHDDVVINNPNYQGTFGASSPVFISNSELGVRVNFDKTNTISFTSSQSLGDGRFIGKLLTNTGASGGVTLTLPQATSSRIGWQIGFQVRSAFQFIIAPTTGDSIGGDTSGFGASSATIGSTLWLECIAANQWAIVNQTGPWEFAPSTKIVRREHQWQQTGNNETGRTLTSFIIPNSNVAFLVELEAVFGRPPSSAPGISRAVKKSFLVVRQQNSAVVITPLTGAGEFDLTSSTAGGTNDQATPNLTLIRAGTEANSASQEVKITGDFAGYVGVGTAAGFVRILGDAANDVKFTR